MPDEGFALESTEGGVDFRLSPEQQMLRDSARRRLADTSGDASARWRSFAELGWLAMPVTESSDGLGASLADLSILFEECGRALSRDALLETLLLPARLIESAASPAQRADHLPALMSGERRYAVALYEPGRRDALAPRLRATRAATSDYRLQGSKARISGGAQADLAVLTAQVDGEPEAALFIVDLRDAGLVRHDYERLDGSPVADLKLEQVAAERLCGAPAVIAQLEDAMDEALILQCADLVGAMDRAIEMVVEHLRTRRQFGRALAEFQALQHTVAELFIDSHAARSLLFRALAHADAPRGERQAVVSGAWIGILDAAQRITGTAVHLHGGVGVSCEYPIGHLLRRVTAAGLLWGDRERHLRRYMNAAVVP